LSLILERIQGGSVVAARDNTFLGSTARLHGARKSLETALGLL
jgi:hypothetical protein